MPYRSGPGKISHFGVVAFEKGAYIARSGSSNWTVQPIPGFGQEIGPPLGQVKVILDPPADRPYTVILSAERSPGAPLLMANYGGADPKGFVVHVFDPVSSRTLQNGNFSFVVLQIED